MILSPKSERDEVLDVLRGFAIFGMFTVNLTADAMWSDAFDSLAAWSPDFIALLFVNLFTNGKFITIFSFLFGIGFYIQVQSCIRNDVPVGRFWLKRLSGLFLIGFAANALTVPAGILIDYSLFGLGLLVFYRLAPRQILVVAIMCIIIPKVSGPVFDALLPVDAGTDAHSLARRALRDEFNHAATYGSFAELSWLRLQRIWYAYSDWRYYFGDLDLLGLMLIGLLVARLGAIADLQLRITLARRMLPWLLTIGFLGCVAWVAMETFGLGQDATEYHDFIAGTFAWPVGMPVLGLGYAAGIVLLCHDDNWRRRLRIFAPIGRMALTNYLFTGFVGAYIGFNWGLGLYGKVFPAAGLLIVVALLPLQALASRWWLSRFDFGPFEWLWRYWTYGRRPTKPA